MPHRTEPEVSFMTDLNARKLSKIYDMSESVYHEYLEMHRQQLYDLATKRVKRSGKIIVKQNYNSKQLHYIVNVVFHDLPFGWKFDGKTFVQCDN